MMRAGRIKQSVMDRSVKRILSDVLTSNPEGYNGIFQCEGWTLAPERLIYGLIHQTIAMGISPAVIAVEVILPEKTEEEKLKQLMKTVNSLCCHEKIKISAVQVSVSCVVSDLVLFASVTKSLKTETEAGKTEAEMEEKEVKADKKKRQDRLDNLDVVVAGTVGLEGAAVIAKQKKKELQNRYAESYIEHAARLYDNASMQNIREIFLSNAVSRVYAAGEGGVFAAFWNLAAQADVGLDLSLKSIPIDQHVIEVCEYYDVNPYLLFSGGSFVLFCDRGEKLVSDLTKNGVLAAVVGKTTSGNDRIIRYDDEIRYLEPPKIDELYKVWRL